MQSKNAFPIQCTAIIADVIPVEENFIYNVKFCIR